MSETILSSTTHGGRIFNTPKILPEAFVQRTAMIVEVRDMRDDSFRIIFPNYSRWIELSANEMYSLPCLTLEEFKKLFGNKLRPLPEDDFKKYVMNLSDEELAELRDAMARNIAPGNVRIYPV